MSTIDALEPNTLVRSIGKPAEQFTRDDIIGFIEREGITMINFRYVAGDGRLKKLNFPINSRAHLEQVLTLGERVDGSSLFDFVDADASDLYVVPRYRTAFVNPFAEQPTLDLLCSFYDVDGNPLASAPEQVLRRAQDYLEQTTGCRLEALGELEYYLFDEVDSIYPIIEQKGYQESHPYSKWGSIRRETMAHLMRMGAQVKYGHAEVGNIVADGQEMVQHEIEFLPVPIEEAADQLVLAKWVLREVAYRHGLQVSFAPKIIVGQAGSGMHFHTRLSREGKYVFSDGTDLTDDARRVIAGYLQHAASLTAWGNTVPTSYLRLVPHQEAPTAICWGDRNRSVLVRVPLGWRGIGDRMVRDANPHEPAHDVDATASQTVELRSADGSAQVHFMLAGLAVAARRGLLGADSLDVAERLYVAEDASKRDDLDQLPASCHASADALLADREAYEEGGVFPPGLIDAQAAMLRSWHDEDLSEKLFGNADALKDLVAEHLNCG